MISLSNLYLRRIYTIRLPYFCWVSTFWYILEDPEGSHARGYNMEKQTLALLSHIPWGYQGRALLTGEEKQFVFISP